MTLCDWHKKGVPPEAGLFYMAECPRCEEKLAAGKTTADAIDPRKWVSPRRRRLGQAYYARRPTMPALPFYDESAKRWGRQ